MTAAAGPETPRAAGFRPDIEGLRAVAVLLILLYHAGVPVLGGGYVGVDVFFVISGFLITSLLLRELRENGRLDLWEFYARRARRILPAALLVLVATVVGTLVFLSPVTLYRAAVGIAAAAAYVPNLLFAFERTDYFNPADVSPVTHYWSLGVEEQFYLLWPAFLFLAYRFLARSQRRLAIAVGVVVAGSFVLSFVLTELAPTAAFYLLPTRAWELGAGALLAILPLRTNGRPTADAGGTERGFRSTGTAPAAAAAFAGLAAIGIAGVVFDSSTPFPGLAAILPVAGTALVIAAGVGAGSGAVAKALGWAPLRWIGRISYSLYLWHWPVLLFAGAALTGLPEPVRAAIGVLASFALADVTYRLVEDPLRRGRVVGRRPKRNVLLALVGSAVVIAIAYGGSRLAVAPFRPVDDAAAAPEIPLGVDPFLELIPGTGTTVDGPLPRDLIPPLLNLHRGRTETNPRAKGCSLLSGETINPPCTFGSDAPAMKVVLFGDSHLAQWWPAIERIMIEKDWQVVFLIKTSCTYADVTAMSSGGPKRECDTWRARTLDRIAAEAPDLVIVASNHRPPPLVDGVVLEGAAADTAMAAGAERTIERLQATGARVVVLSDTPQIPFDPAECLSANAEHVIRCAIPREEAVDPSWGVAERGAAEARGATYVDVNAWACPSDPCPMVLGRYAVFADTNHMTPTFIQGLTLRLEAAILGQE